MSIREFVEEAKYYLNQKCVDDALESLLDLGIEVSSSDIDFEHSIAENDDRAMSVYVGFYQVIRALHIFVSEDESLLCTVDVKDIESLFDKVKKTSFLYFNTDNTRNFGNGFESLLQKVSVDNLKHVSKAFLMFLGDFNLVQVNDYGEKIASMLPAETDMVIGVLRKTNGFADIVECKNDVCDNLEVSDFTYEALYPAAEIVCLMI